MTVLVVSDYESTYPDPISVREGDPVVVGDLDQDNPVWAWCTGPDGRGGWTPVPFVKDGRAVRDYAATEATVSAGMAVEVIERFGGWTRVRPPGGVAGWVPDACLDLCGR